MEELKVRGTRVQRGSSNSALLRVAAELANVGQPRAEPRRRRVKYAGVQITTASDAHSSLMVSWAPSSATKMASRLAGSVALAFSLTRCSLPGG
jgi:hypothetical protein